MADRQIINNGSAPNDDTGDSPRQFASKSNANFQELFARFAPDYIAGLSLEHIASAPGDWRSALGLTNPINVKHYGATGDGATDDAAAIQSAINAAQDGTSPNAVYFPPGVYIISTGLTITQPICAFGDNFTGKFNTSPYRVVGAEIRYTGTGTALDVQTYRAIIRDLRFTSPANAAYGIKLKGEESYLYRVNIGTEPGYGFQTGLYADNASILVLEDLILSCNTVHGIFLDCQTGACSDVKIIKPHLYHTPIGIRLSVNAGVRIVYARAEAVQWLVYAENTSAQNLNLQEISIIGTYYLNNPGISPGYTQGRLIKILAQNDTQAMSIRGLTISLNHVLNIGSDYDIEGTFGAIVPTCERITVTKNNFWASTVAAMQSDCAQFVPLMHTNSIPTAAAHLSLTNGGASAPMELQGLTPSIVVGVRGTETLLRFVSGAQAGYPAYLQAGVDENDSQATFILSLLNTAAGRLAFAKIYATTLEQHGDIQIFDANDLVRMRLLANSSDGKAYLQAGQDLNDSAADLVFARKDTSIGKLRSITAYATSIVLGEGFQVDENTTGSQTKLQILDTTSGTFKRVKLAPTGAIPAGKQILYID